MSIHTPPREWKLPLNLAIGLHLLVLFFAMVLPGLMNQRTIMPEMTTIDLVSMAEPAAQSKPAGPPAAKKVAKQETAPPAPPKPAEIIKPEVTKQIPLPLDEPDPVPLPEPTVAPEPVAPPAPAEAISIKPLKQKLKKVIKEIPDTTAEDARIRKDELKNITKKLQEEAKIEDAAQETIKRQRQLATAREEARRADLEARMTLADARMAATEARNAVADQIRATTASTSQTSSQTSSSNAQSMGIVQQQYFATIMGHIQQYWRPPDIKSWDPNILAVVSITIASDGQIVSQDFEQSSGDQLFDQFVLKTLEAANPLPAPPPGMQNERITVGLRFKPSGIQ